MSTLTIQLDDDAARLVREAAQLADQPLEFWLREKVCQAAARAVNGGKSAVRRVSPLHPGAMQPAPDFNAPLEEFAPYECLPQFTKGAGDRRRQNHVGDKIMPAVITSL